MTRAARKSRTWKAWAVVCTDPRFPPRAHYNRPGANIACHNQNAMARRDGDEADYSVIRVLITELPTSPRRGAKGARKGRTA